MNVQLLMDFVVDKANNTIRVTREFNAPIDSVWSAWTTQEILDQWWAPKPWISKTASMDFKVGGRRLYAMVGPSGEEHWALADYTSITPTLNFRFLDAFCDREGNINTSMARSNWDVSFSEAQGVTTAHIEIKLPSLKGLEQIIQMGFREGFTMALTNLDEIL